MSMLVVAIVIITIMAMSMISFMIVVTVMRAPVFVLGPVRYVAWLIFRRSNEIHRPVASIVLMAILVPILCVPRRHVQVDGRRRCGLRFDHHRLRIDDRGRRCIAKLNLPVDPRRDLAR
jgi:hypothetical protein